MKKVLIIHASAGDGHKKAAEALYESFLNLDNNKIKAVLVDALEYTTPFFGFGYKKAYEIMIKRMPWIWGFLYHMLNNRFFFAVATPFRRLVNGLNSRRLEKFILKENFDLVLSTHFFAPEVISYLKEKGLSQVKLINISTDFKPHRFWIAKNIDRYFVASEITKQGFIKMGLSEDKISVSGIPISRKFNALASKEHARNSIGIKEDKFTILLMGGGLGIGPIKEILLDLQKLSFDFQIIAVCGRNESLADELGKLSCSLNKKTIVYGFTNQIDTLMAASDIMISKTGGATVSESLAAGLPIIALRPIPGQETGNVAFLCGNGIGFWVKRLDEINGIIIRLFKSKEDIDKLKSSIRHWSKPRAAEDIARLAMEMIE